MQCRLGRIRSRLQCLPLIIRTRTPDRRHIETLNRSWGPCSTYDMRAGSLRWLRSGSLQPGSPARSAPGGRQSGGGAAECDLPAVRARLLPAAACLTLYDVLAVRQQDAALGRWPGSCARAAFRSVWSVRTVWARRSGTAFIRRLGSGRAKVGDGTQYGWSQGAEVSLRGWCGSWSVPGPRRAVLRSLACAFVGAAACCAS